MKATGVLALSALFLFVFWVLRDRRQDPGSWRTPAPDRPEAPGLEGGLYRSAQGVPPGRTNQPAEAPAPPAPRTLGRGSLVVHAVRAGSDVPVVGIPLSLEHSRPSVDPLLVTDSEGTAVFPDLLPGRVAVFSAGTHVAADVIEGTTTAVRLEVGGRGSQEVQVVDERGVGIGGAHVYVSRRPLERLGFMVGRTNALGFLTIDDFEPGRWITASAEGRIRSDCYEPEQSERAGPVQIVMREGGRVFQGTVVNLEGDAIGGAVVRVGGTRWPRMEPPERLPLPGHFPVMALTDLHGRFAVDGLPERSLDVRVSASGFGRWIGESLVGESPVVIRLHTGAKVVGVVQDSSQFPIPFAYVAWVGQGDVFTVGLGDGRFEIDTPGAGTFELEARTNDFRMGIATVRVPAEGVVSAQVTLDPSLSVEGTLIDASGRATAGWTLGWTVPFAQRPHALARTSDAGSFRFWRDKVQAPQVLVASPPGMEPTFPLEVGSWNGEDRIELQAGFMSADLGTIRLQLLEEWVVKLYRDSDQASAAGILDDDGSYRFEGLLPGDYRLEFLDIRTAYVGPSVRVDPGSVRDLGLWIPEDLAVLERRSE